MATPFQAVRTRLGFLLAVDLLGSVAISRSATSADAAETPTKPGTVSFQYGVNGYAGVEDFELEQFPCTGTDCPRLVQPRVLVDKLNGAAGESQGLLRFDGIFGNAPEQIPPGATILSATLTLQSTAGNANGDPVNLHRMLQPWSSSTATWSSFVDGVQANDIEARTNTDATILSKTLTVPFAVELEVRSAVQAWANGELNLGWVFLAIGTDGYMFDRYLLPTGPRLEVVYVIAAPALTITNEAANVVIRWTSDSAWELVSSQSIDRAYTPVADNPSGTFVIPQAAQTNQASFFRLRFRAASP